MADHLQIIIHRNEAILPIVIQPEGIKIMKPVKSKHTLKRIHFNPVKALSRRVLIDRRKLIKLCLRAFGYEAVPCCFPPQPLTAASSSTAPRTGTTGRTIPLKDVIFLIIMLRILMIP